MTRETDSLTERASKGGRARAASLTATERSESARRAVQARWAKHRPKPTVTITVGVIQRAPAISVQITRTYQPVSLATLDAGSRTVNAGSSVMTMEELANWLHVSEKTIQRWIKIGVPVINIGGPTRPDWRFVWKEVRAWLDAGKPAKEEGAS